MRGKHFVFALLLITSLWLAGCAEAEEAPIVEEQAPLEDIVEKPQPGDMVLIPAGEFTMGAETDPHRLKLAEPAHKVDLPAYEIDVYEVTNGDFARFQIESDYEAQGDWRAHYTIGREDYPVANVTFEDAKAYCEYAGERLPTEAEWEKAARGNEELRYPWGAVFDWSKANVNEQGTRDTSEVGSFEEDKSPYGAYDMFGNVQEWVDTPLAPYPNGKVVDRNVFNRNYIVVRGASYAMKGDGMWLFSRTAAVPNAQFGYGFRCVKGVEEPAAEGGE